MLASLLVAGFMIVLTLLSVVFFGAEVGEGPLQVSMTLSTLLALGVAYYYGFRGPVISQAIGSGIHGVLGTVFVLLAIGTMIGTLYLTGAGALSGAFWGMLFGLIFFVPFFGMAVGAAMGALSGHFANYGIDKEFTKQAQQKVTAGTSALFLMTSDAVGDKVTDAVKNSGLKFDMFYTNLSKEQEAQLREDFGA
jgi:hypothetical protein